MLAEAQLGLLDAEVKVPLHALVAPVLEGVLVGAGLDKVLHLHLLELTRAEDEVAGRNLVAEGLADLRDAERDAAPTGLPHVLEVDVDALRRLRTQIDDGGVLFDWPHERLEHKVELASLADVGAAAVRALAVANLVRAEAMPALAAVDHGIGEVLHVARGLPDARMHQDGGVQRLDVVAQ